MSYVESPQRSILLAASYTMKIYAIDMDSGDLVDELDTTNTQTNRLCHFGGSHFGAATYCNIYAYDLNARSRKQYAIFTGHTSNINDLFVHEDKLISCSEDKTAMIWDLKTSQKIQTIYDGCPVNSVFMHPDGNILYTGNESGAVSIWDIRNTYSSVKKAFLSSQPIRSLALYSDGSAFVAAAQDGRSCLFGFSSETDIYPIRKFFSHREDITLRAVCSPGGNYFATTSADGTAKLWTRDGESHQILHSGDTIEWVWDAAFTSDDKLIATAHSDGVCRLWETENGRMINQLPPLEKCVSAISIIEY